MNQKMDWVIIIAIIALVFAAICLMHIVTSLLALLLWFGLPIISIICVSYLFVKPSYKRRSY